MRAVSGITLLIICLLLPAFATEFTKSFVDEPGVRCMAVGVLSGILRLLLPVGGYMNIEH